MGWGKAWGQEVKAEISMIEGEGDGGVYDDDGLRANEDKGVVLVLRMSDDHQSNVVQGHSTCLID